MIIYLKYRMCIIPWCYECSFGSRCTEYTASATQYEFLLLWESLIWCFVFIVEAVGTKPHLLNPSSGILQYSAQWTLIFRYSPVYCAVDSHLKIFSSIVRSGLSSSDILQYSAQWTLIFRYSPVQCAVDSHLLSYDVSTRFTQGTAVQRSTKI